MFPRIEHFLLSDYKKGKAGKVPELQPLIERCKAAGFAGLGLQYHWPIDARFTAQVKSSGLKLLVWTVDDAIVARRLRDAGVDAITTNKPRLLREELGLK
jgi:glycerophosphoryl diester phosphodiesterase